MSFFRLKVKFVRIWPQIAGHFYCLHAGDSVSRTPTLFFSSFIEVLFYPLPLISILHLNNFSSSSIFFVSVFFLCFSVISYFIFGLQVDLKNMLPPSIPRTFRLLQILYYTVIDKSCTRNLHMAAMVPSFSSALFSAIDTTYQRFTETKFVKLYELNLVIIFSHKRTQTEISLLLNKGKDLNGWLQPDYTCKKIKTYLSGDVGGLNLLRY